MGSRVSRAQAFDHAAELHDLVLQRARDSDPTDPDEVINLALAVLIHGLLERIVVFADARYLSPELLRELEAEHASLREAVSLMVELAEEPGQADDLRALCHSVYGRTLRHVERDERVLYGSLARLRAAEAPRIEDT